MNKKEFIESKKEMTISEYEYAIGYVAENSENGVLLVYADFAYILKEDKKYNLVIENSEYQSENLKELEDILWDWAQYEV